MVYRLIHKRAYKVSPSELCCVEGTGHAETSDARELAARLNPFSVVVNVFAFVSLSPIKCT